MTNRVAVIGGAGFIGRSLASNFSILGSDVCIFDNLERSQRLSGHIEILLNKYPIRYKRLDVTEKNDVLNGLQEYDEIFNLAAINGTSNFYQNPLRVLEVGAVGAINVAEAVIKYGSPNYWIFSSSEVYGTPNTYPTPEEVDFMSINPKNRRHSYAAGKIISEMTAEYISKSATKIRIIRPHNVYGPNMGTNHVVPELVIKFRKMINEKRRELTIQGSGNETRAFCFIQDFIDAINLIRNSPYSGEIFNIGTKSETSVIDLIKELSKIYSLNFEDLSIICDPLLAGSTQRRVPLIEKVEALGFQPRISLSEGLKIYAKQDMDTKKIKV